MSYRETVKNLASVHVQADDSAPQAFAVNDSMVGAKFAPENNGLVKNDAAEAAILVRMCTVMVRTWCYQNRIPGGRRIHPCLYRRRITAAVREDVPGAAEAR